MIERTSQHGQPARPWDVVELDAADALRRNVGRRVIRRIPTVKEQNDTGWRACDQATRDVMRELGRLGYDLAGIVDERVYFTNVGARVLSVVLRVDYRADGVKIERVIVGAESFTARQAAGWLRKRAARERKYL